MTASGATVGRGSTGLLILTTAHAVAKFATWLSFVAALMRVQEALQLSLGLALLIASRRLPAMAFSYPGGLLADRYCPKGVVVAATAAMMGVLLLLWGLDFSGSGFYPPLLLSFVALSGLEGIYKPALQALLERVSPSRECLERANTALSASGMLTVLLASALSPLLALRMGLNALLLFNAAIYLIALALFLAVPARAHCLEPRALSGARREAAPFSLAALGLNCAVSVAYAFTALAVIQYPYEVYRETSLGTAMMSATMGLGIFLSVPLYALRPAPPCLTAQALWDRARLPAVLLCGAFLLFARAEALRWALPCLAAAMCCLGYLKMLAENVFLLSSPAGLVGRSFSMFFIADEAVVASASILLGFLADRSSLASVGSTLSLGGVGIILFTLVIGGSLQRPEGALQALRRMRAPRTRYPTGLQRDLLSAGDNRYA